MEQVKDVPLYLRIPEDIKDKIKEAAKKKRMSVNQFMILIAEKELGIK